MLDINLIPGLRTADCALAQTLKRCRPGTSKDIALIIALASRAVSLGHQALPLANAEELLYQLNIDPIQIDFSVQRWRSALENSDWVSAGSNQAIGFPLVFEHDIIYLRRYWKYECELANTVKKRMQLPALDVDNTLLASLLQVIFLDDIDQQKTSSFNAQAAAAALSTRQSLLLITGGPGTGKTRTIARLLMLQLLLAIKQDKQLRVALVAPTGKAATQLNAAMQQALTAMVEDMNLDEGLRTAVVMQWQNLQAQTVHRLLGASKYGKSFSHDIDNPLALDLLIVDEASMLDVSLMHRLVTATPLSASLLLVGDPDQLPAIEAGDVLAALRDGIEQHPLPSAVISWLLSVLPSTSASTATIDSQLVRAVTPASISLTQGYRQKEQTNLSHWIQLVRDGDADASIAALTNGQNDQSHVALLWQSNLRSQDIADQAAVFYQTLMSLDTPAQALQHAKKFKILSALRDGLRGVNALNVAVERALMRALANTSRATYDKSYFHGQLLLITQNSYRHRLFNGDIGIVWADGTGQLSAWFDSSDGLCTWSLNSLPTHESAFAMTVHKAQGSEFDEVLLVLPAAPSRMLTRALLYTGATRARHMLTIAADEIALRAAINQPTSRWSGLAKRLKPD